MKPNKLFLILFPHKYNLSLIVLILLCGVNIRLASAQKIRHGDFNFIPLGNQELSAPNNARLQRQLADTLVLPFWDDFSYANNNTVASDFYLPDRSKWASGSESVRVNTGLDINAPTVGIATFDGVDSVGAPYSLVETDEGQADELISLPINLSVIPQNERQSVYFSFFWQQTGLGEFPDQVDSIRLQFKNSADEWITQWSQSGGDTLVNDFFQQEMIQVINPGFYHSGFQFRFQSFNRLSGAFDTWNIDYIYMNSGRTASNTAYLDRALASLPTSPFGEYTAVPMRQFVRDPNRYIGTSSVDFYNLNIQLQPVRFTALLRDVISGEIIETLNDDIAISPIPPGLERRTISANSLNINNILAREQDSLYIQTEFNITSGDNFLIENIIAGDTIFNQQVDYRVNDTVRTTYVLDEHFAYDDGEAEFGLEVNQNGGRVAYQYELPASDLLTHIDIYFPPLNRNQSAIPFQLMVWRSLEDSLGEEVILRSQQAQTSSTSLNEFVSYELASPVVVEDTFYIGYEQIGDVYIAIGYDRNTDSADKMFYNVTGAWTQDSSLQGSMMIRPRFDKDRDVTSVEEPVSEHEDISIYPNPSDGTFRLSSDFDKLYMYDALGRLVIEVDSKRANEEIFTPLAKGIYFLRIIRGQEKISKKLIIQ